MLWKILGTIGFIAVLPFILAGIGIALLIATAMLVSG